MMCLQAKEHQRLIHAQKLEEARKDSFQQVAEGVQPANTLIFHF